MYVYADVLQNKGVQAVNHQYLLCCIIYYVCQYSDFVLHSFSNVCYDSIVGIATLRAGRFGDRIESNFDSSSRSERVCSGAGYASGVFTREG
jgi:hypothetical protein